MSRVFPTALDIDDCAAEPIRIPGGIQPHGVLIVVDAAGLQVRHVSDNAASALGTAVAVGDSITDIVGEGLAQDLESWRDGSEALFLRTARVGAAPFQISAHRSPQGIFIEFEAASADERETLEAVYPRLRAFVDEIGVASSVQAIAEIAVRELRILTGFNRVMLYSFDTQGDGTVLAEAGDGKLPSYLDLRFPASDIPSQARQLYCSNRLRLIPSADYQAARMLPPVSTVDGKPLDLSGAVLRSVSPVHLEYMRNMGTWASMSISVLVDGQLWGLISCHNREARRVNAHIRSACDFLGQIVSMQIGARERSARAQQRIQLQQVTGELLARMSHAPDFHQGVSASADAWLRLMSADGIAVVSNEGLTRVGLTPSDFEIQELAARLRSAGNPEVHATDQLSSEWPQAESFANVASGLLAISISQLHPSYILWFRQEVVRTVRWGGDPRKEPGADRLHPRKSFDIWKEQVRLKSIRWDAVETEAAQDLRHAIINFVLRRAEERAALSEQLQKTNAELEAFSYSVSHDLRAPFRHIVGYAELLSSREKDLDEKSRHYVDSITESALHAGRLVDDLLAFSQMGRTTLTSSRVDMRKLVAEVRHGREPDIQGRNVEWQIGELPPTHGDPSLLRQVWANLIDNALKYSTSRDLAVIRIDGRVAQDALHYTVSDNGVGFEMNYVGKLFGVFQRLHRSEQYPGTGIGLALVKRIVERHGGTVSAESEAGRGATFGFTLPHTRR
jgi:chemotaxis family two-component system sensor kinase Cph1